MRFVLDASVALAWFFVDERSDYSMSVHQSLEHCQAIVPWIWPFEVANVFWSASVAGGTHQRTARSG